MVIGVIHLDIFNLDVAVFRTEKARIKELEKQGCVTIAHTPAAIASAHLDLTGDGAPRFSMVIKKHATKATWAHECTHIADMVMQTLGIPTGHKNTEVRAYLVGHLFAHLEGMLG